MNTKPCPECGRQMKRIQGDYHCLKCVKAFSPYDARLDEGPISTFDMSDAFKGHTPGPKFSQKPPTIDHGNRTHSEQPIQSDTINWPEKRVDIAARIMAARIAAGDSPNPEWVVMKTDRLIEELKKSNP